MSGKNRSQYSKITKTITDITSGITTKSNLRFNYVLNVVMYVCILNDIQRRSERVLISLI